MALPHIRVDKEKGNVAVKICGITSPELATSAARAGADMIGLVFAPSRRQVSPESARQIRRELALREDATGERPLVVGVFVNEPPRTVVQMGREVGLDILQLSGDESVEDVYRCAEYYPVLKAFRFSAAEGADAALEMVGRYTLPASGQNVRPLIDAHTPGAYGGTGHLADWSLAAALAAEYPLVLAGGLTPGNIARALESVQPWGVDVSSGVELDGRKNPSLMESFVDAVRACESAGAAKRGKVEIAL
jgi:phosphoribosylanthranilate isomerase